MFYRGQVAEEVARVEANKIKLLGKVAIIELANQRLKCAYPELDISPSDYHVTVQANAFEVQVSYRRYICYTPARLKDKTLYYDVWGNLVDQNISPFESEFSRENFFVETEEDKKNIRFVVGNSWVPHADNTTHIVEQDTCFSVVDKNLNDYGLFEWEVVKATGERIDHPWISMTPADLEPSPFNAYRWVPIYE